MGLPWQADSGMCRSNYVPDYDLYLPTFWPARVPNQVLTEPNYDIVVDANQPMERRLAAFDERMRWEQPLAAPTPAGEMAAMVRLFGDMGLVETRPGVVGDANFPEEMMVATFGPAIVPPPPLARRLMAARAAPSAAKLAKYPVPVMYPTASK